MSIPNYTTCRIVNHLWRFNTCYSTTTSWPPAARIGSHDTLCFRRVPSSASKPQLACKIHADGLARHPSWLRIQNPFIELDGNFVLCTFERTLATVPLPGQGTRA